MCGRVDFCVGRDGGVEVMGELFECEFQYLFFDCGGFFCVGEGGGGFVGGVDCVGDGVGVYVCQVEDWDCGGFEQCGWGLCVVVG